MPDTTPQVLAVMALMREIEKPSACYSRAVRRASQTLTDSPENDAAQARGNAALLEIEQAVRAWVAKHPEPAPARQDLGTTDRSAAPLAAGLPLVTGRCPACGTTGLFLGDGGYVTCSLIGCPAPDAASTVLERPQADEAQQPDTIGLCGACGDPREGHHHGYERTPHAADEAQQPETEAALPLPGPPCIPDHSLPVHCPGCAHPAP